VSDSLAKYAETALIKTIQELYSAEMDLATNVFDAEGRVNIVAPSNLVPLCAEILRGCTLGMTACRDSDRNGGTLLRWAISDPVGRKPKPDFAETKMIGQVTPAFGIGSGWHPPIAVVYECRAGFVDFAVPIFDPEAPSDRRLLSIAYGGQYLGGKVSREEEIHRLWPRLLEKIADSGNGGQQDRAKIMLQHSRQANWDQIVLASHVMFTLGNAVARLGYLDRPTKLTWSEDNTLRVYFEAFRTLSGAHDGCIVRYDKWTSTFGFGVRCKSFDKVDCHRDTGPLFTRLRSDSSLDYLASRDTPCDPWRVGQEWVVQEYVFAVRNSRHDLLAIVNLNLAEGAATPSGFCVDAMVHLARQLGLFFEVEGFCRPLKTKLELDARVSRIADARLSDPDTASLCSSVTKELRKQSGGSGAINGGLAEDARCKPRNQSGSRRASREYLIWLVDKADSSESARYLKDFGVEHVLTCYAIGDRYPLQNLQSQYIDDVPVDWDAIHKLFDLSVMDPADLEGAYSQLRKSKAFGDEFVHLRDGEHHLMVLPIGAENDRERRVWGLLIVVDSVTNYITEEDREAYLAFCDRLFDALMLSAERSRRHVEEGVGKPLPVEGRDFLHVELHKNLRRYLGKVLESIIQETKLEGVSVFMRTGFPEHDPNQPGRVVLWAAKNHLPKVEDKSVIVNGGTGQPVPEDRFHEVGYEAGEGCTGLCAMRRDQTVRISDLDRHRRAFEDGKVPGGPEWKGQWQEVRDPQIPRRGTICVPLQGATGYPFGLLRASTRSDALRLTRYDEETMSKIGEMLSRQIELYTYQTQLGRRAQALATITRSLEAILRTATTVPTYETCLKGSVLVPIVLRQGLGLGRAVYCELWDSGVVDATIGLGGRTTAENQVIKDRATAAFAQLMRTGHAGDRCDPYQDLWDSLRRESLGFCSKFFCRVGADAIKASPLVAALKAGGCRIVRPCNGRDPVEEAIFQAAQGNFEHRTTFGCVSVSGSPRAPYLPLTFLYVDSPFAEDEAVTGEAVQAIWTFSSVLAGLWSAVQLRRETTEGIRHTVHEIGNLLGGVVKSPAQGESRQETGVRLAYYRARAVQAAFDPMKKSAIHADAGSTASLRESMQRLFTYYRPLTQGLGLGDEALEAPPPTGVRVSCDSGILDTILGQLLDNAVKFVTRTPGGPKMGFLLPTPAAGGSFVETGVWDTGPGMPHSCPDDLYYRPFRGHPDIEGAGLGLITCRMLLDLCAPGSDQLRKIWHEPRPQGGTVFKILLPLASIDAVCNADRPT
jgi:ligand-binding sensor protein